MTACKALRIATTACGFVLISGISGAENYVVEQSGKEFVYKGSKIAKLKIKLGDVVEFKNADPFFHNVFSLSDVKLFDLGSYPQGKSKSVKFEKTGVVEIECAIHPQMHMTVEVK